jgi:crotonobetainyl-CoA:carnitine CoA-transferase CaiB-like acyl-CoA transferase
MAGPLAGVRLLEVSTHVFVPMAGAVLSDWGADVIKIEAPDGGDPYRGLVTAGLHKLHHGVDVHFESTNRGKRSVALDLKHPDGRQLLSRLIETSDVFATNLRPDARRRLSIDPEDVRAENPSIIYVRGSAFGTSGPEAERGGYDAGAYWARSGMQQIFTGPEDEWPASPRAAFGDVVGGLTIAGAIGTALFQRSATGRPSIIDVSLLAMGMWQVQMDIMNATLDDGSSPPRARPSRYDMPNPLMLPYRTGDGRFINLQMLSPDRFWPDLCKVLGHSEVATDPRFADIDSRRANAHDCIVWLESIFAARSFDEWQRILADFPGEWVPSLRPNELAKDPQVVSNGYMSQIELQDFTLTVVAPPVQFDGQPAPPRRAPELGEQTEEVLLELGLSWNELAELKESGAIL